ncbi:hypothetical protein [Candidatus Thiosymbion oneisti]|uniref:hypothetical protein n=1 Tax=Candidatus Thiosymbion oneisti TaxID=589554 RepID=UPI00105BDA88|nr:hypothetical protein [Candidatus Thiosymbion oneisti]
MKKFFPVTQFPVSNVSPAKEALAKEYDQGNKGYLTADELAELYVRKVPEADGFVPEDLGDVLEFLGVQQKIRQDYVDSWEAMVSYQIYTNDWRGDFNITGIGAGHVKTGRRMIPNDKELFLFDFVLDRIDKDYLLDNLNDARLVVGPKDFPAFPGNIEPEKRFLAMTFSPQTTVRIQPPRFSSHYWNNLPEPARCWCGYRRSAKVGQGNRRHQFLRRPYPGK